MNANLGLSVEYQSGDTPVAQKEIDQVTVGMEVRF
jgi:hypothetical protein